MGRPRNKRGKQKQRQSSTHNVVSVDAAGVTDRIRTFDQTLRKLGLEKDVLAEVTRNLLRSILRRGLTAVIPACLVAVVALVVWNWESVIKLPIVGPTLLTMTEKALPAAVPQKFNVAVARLVGDDKREMERLITESLQEFPGVASLSFDRLIDLSDGGRDKAISEGHDRARSLLIESGADVLIWGVVIRQDGNSRPKLYYTTRQNLDFSFPHRRYEVKNDLSLPDLFWQDLTDVLLLIVATSDIEVSEGNDKHHTEAIEKFIQRVQALLQRSSSAQWNSSTRAQVLSILGSALNRYGGITGDRRLLQRAVLSQQQALKVLNREELPLVWADVQSKLADALLNVGINDLSTIKLEEAVTAYREALAGFAKETRLPLNLIANRANLGITLALLAERKNDNALFAEAADIFRQILAESPRKADLRSWAVLRLNLGHMLRTWGSMNSDKEHIRDAVLVYRETLQFVKRDTMPELWSDLQSNLSVAQLLLGDSPDALKAQREAVNSRLAMETSPISRAANLHQLGTSLVVEGERQSNADWIAESVTLFREALRNFTPRDSPVLWARTKISLAGALQKLGEMKADSEILRQAVDEYHLLLQAKVLEEDSTEWATVQFNLGGALRHLVIGEEDAKYIFEARAAFRNAQKVFSRDKHPRNWAHAQHNICITYSMEGARNYDASILADAIKCMTTALHTLRGIDDPDSTKVEEDLHLVQAGLDELTLRSNRRDAAEQ